MKRTVQSVSPGFKGGMGNLIHTPLAQTLLKCTTLSKLGCIFSAKGEHAQPQRSFPVLPTRYRIATIIQMIIWASSMITLATVCTELIALAFLMLIR